MVPTRTSDPEAARRLVASDGAVILPGCGPTADDARAVLRHVHGDSVLALPDAASVREGGEKDRSALGADVPLPLHSDGFAYGDQPPDSLVLVCVTVGDSGGESVLVDGERLLADLDADLRVFLTTVPVDVSQPGMRPAVSPVVLTLADGRRIVRWHPFLRAALDSADPEADRRMIERWDAAVETARVAATRYALEPGDALVVDNFRMLHSRDPYMGDRFLWRVWGWTSAGNGVPSGLLHSDSRYAAV